ncbi:MAG: sensor histidine kinase [Phycisphaerales bacterium]
MAEDSGGKRSPDRREIERLQERLDEVEETLRAIHSGEVDALFVNGPSGEQVFTLSGSERPFRMMFEHMHEGAATLLPDGVITYSNRRLAEMLEAPLESMVGRSILDFIDDPEAARRFLSEARADDQRVELTLRRRSGETLPGLLSTGRFTIEDTECVCLVVADLTAQHMQERLRDSELRFRSAINAARAMTYEMLVGEKVLRGVHGADELVGETLEGGEVSISWWRERIHDDDRDRYESSVADAIAQSEERRTLEYRVRSRDGDYLYVEDHMTIVRGDKGESARAFGVVLDISERKRFEAHQKMLLGELSHRVKNMLATVQSVARLSRRKSKSFDEFFEAFEGRVNALAQAHSLLSRSQWEATSLHDLVQQTTRPYVGGRERIRFEGDEVLVRPNQVLPLSMIIHELTTNAIKHGALSNEDGVVEVEWRLFQNGQGPAIRFEWVEFDGPAVATPETAGFGAGLIKTLVSYELEGKLEYQFPSDGARCRVEFPV